MTNITTNYINQIRVPSSLTNNKWQLEDIINRKTYAVSKIGICVLLFCIQPKNKRVCIKLVADKYQLNIQKVKKVVEDLLCIGFLNESSNKSCETDKINLAYIRDKSKLLTVWQKHHWEAAIDYHLYTQNYQFLDYSKKGDGRKIALQRMINYSNIEPDINRVKRYDHHEKSIPLPTFEQIKSNNNLNTKERILSILSMGFKQRDTKSINWNGVPLIRRTSPSGGSRHPIEGYYISLDEQTINRGIYHIQTEPSLLNYLSAIKESSLCALQTFKKIIHLDKQPIGIIILTCIFERNMYRYRDPRTFRSIHLDTGHIAGTIELVSKYYSIPVITHYEFSIEALENVLSLNPYQEGIMSMLMLYK